MEKDRLKGLLLFSAPLVEKVHNRYNPLPRLELEREGMLIKEELRRAKASVHLELIPASPPILQRKLMEGEFKIIHFMGHGLEEMLCFEDPFGQKQELNAQDLKELFRDKGIHLLILNACHSEELSKKLHKEARIPAIIAIEKSQTIGDKAAIAFSGGFYAALGRGMSVRRAFDEGVNAIKFTTTLKEEAKKYRLISEDRDKGLVRRGEGFSFHLEQTKINNLDRVPPPSPRFIGREEDVVRINEMLDDKHPIITIVGAPGIGKTALVSFLINWYKNRPYFEGITFLDCQDDPSKEGIIRGMGMGLLGEGFMGIPKERWIESLIKAMENERHLFIIDNFELADDDLKDILRRIPFPTKVIVVSRERLGLTGVEKIMEIDTLPLDISFKLFCNLADDAGYPPSEDEYQTIAEICKLLEGYPLPITIAAPHLSTTYTPRSLLNDLKKRMIDVLQDKGRHGEPKERSLKASLDLSWERLSPSARNLWTYLSIFAGGADEDAIENVLKIQDWRTPMDELRSRSLVNHEYGRFRLLNPIREYLISKFPDEERARYMKDMASYLLGIALVCDFGLNTEMAGMAMLRMKVEWPNIRDCIQLVDDPLLIQGYAYALGEFLNRVGLWDIRKDLLMKGIKASECVGDKKGMADLTHNLGIIHQQQGRYDDALKLYDESLKIMRELGDKEGIARSLGQLGKIHESLEDYQNAIRLYLISASIFDELRVPQFDVVLGWLNGLMEKIGEKRFNYYIQQIKKGDRID